MAFKANFLFISQCSKCVVFYRAKLHDSGQGMSQREQGETEMNPRSKEKCDEEKADGFQTFRPRRKWNAARHVDYYKFTLIGWRAYVVLMA